MVGHSRDSNRVAGVACGSKSIIGASAHCMTDKSLGNSKVVSDGSR